MLKPNTSPKSPRIELSNDTFAERKCCQLFAYESETFHRRRSYGISHCENGEQKPPNPPLSLARRGPTSNTSNTAMPRHTTRTSAPPQTAAPTVEALLHTDAVKCTLVTMARPKFAFKSIPSRGLIAKPHHLPHPWTRLTYDGKRHPDPIRRFSTMHWTDRQ